MREDRMQQVRGYFYTLFVAMAFVPIVAVLHFPIARAQSADDGIEPPANATNIQGNSKADQEPGKASSGNELGEVPAIPDRLLQLVKTQCFDCHAGGTKEGNFELDKLLDANASEDTRVSWWKVLNNVRAGTMPPPSSGTRLAKQDIHDLAKWIQIDIFQTDPKMPDPGHVTLRRLNRNEYGNTIRDLMGIEFNADIVFPPDDTGFGFDNIGDALSLSPMVLEKYLAAASEIVQKSVPTVTRVIPVQRFDAKDFRSASGEDADNMRMQKELQVSKQFRVDVEGSYELDIQLRVHGSFEFSPQRCRLKIEVDQSKIHESEYGWDESKVFRIPTTQQWNAGDHRIEFHLVPLALADNEKPSEAVWAEIDVQSVTVEGPADPKHWKHPPGYERFFPRDEPPSEEPERTNYAREVLREFTLKAFRRPGDEETINKLTELASRWYSQPGVSFESGIAQAMIPVLASPRFLFRLEGTAASSNSVDPSSDRFPLIDEFALATRLSYFLWSTTPDDELFELARAGRLREQLDSQIDRLMRDSRSRAMSRNFVGQWLRTRDVEKVTIDSLAALGYAKEFEALLEEFRRSRQRFRERAGEQVDPELAKRRARFRELASLRDTLSSDVKVAMRRETEMLFEHIVHEDRSLLELISADYTFLNEALAKVYGIDDVRGREMRMVKLPSDSPRGGILTQGTMLTVTSNPTRTSPVKRGLYVLENILGTPTPPAPPNVPALEDSAGKFGDRKPTLKELLAVHRESALCSSCHSRMDPLGLALENFNALGMYREEQAGQKIDSSGELITGEKFQNVSELKRVIANERREDYYRCLTQKLLTYALGRGLDYHDEYTVDEIVTQLSKNEGRFRDLVRGIIYSSAFQRHRPTITAPPQQRIKE